MRRRAKEYPFYDMAGPIPIVHRGGNAAGPDSENTVEAFESAHSRGISYGEIDVCGTIDEKAVAIHGTRMSRRWIARHTYEEFLQKPGFGKASLLEEVLDGIADMRFFVDLKMPQAIKPTARAIDQLKAHDRVSVGTDKYGQEVAAELNGYSKDVCVGVSSWGSAVLKAADVTSVHIPHFALHKKLIERAHDQGIHVIAWPKKPQKNDHRDYIEASLDKGVYGVKSDHTEELVDVFSKRSY